MNARSRFYSPLRYPGGKSQLCSTVSRVMRRNNLHGGIYVEPYAGGASVALELLLTERVTDVYLNDISYPLYSFWSAVIDKPEDLCRRIRDVSVTPSQWNTQKQILKAAEDEDSSDVAFAFFFLNRTNRSGVINGGMIGGKKQSGTWKIDARFNKRDLIARIERIAGFSSRIHLSNLDALAFLRSTMEWAPSRSLTYLDPPYFNKGQRLYANYYHPEDHETIAGFLRSEYSLPWIVSYDDCKEIRTLYDGLDMDELSIEYSAHRRSQGREVLYYSQGLSPLVGPSVETPNLALVGESSQD